MALFTEPLLKLLSAPKQALWFNPEEIWDQVKLLVIAFFLFSFSCCAASFVNINRFSLYDLYRMRLTREFLGASNRGRRPDRWTGFDETDDVHLGKL
jgi:hypothetical protein